MITVDKIKRSINLLLKTKIKLFDNSIYIMYGNYGGWGFSFGQLYNNKHEQIQTNPYNSSYESYLSLDEYNKRIVELIPITEPIDEFDICFKIHDIDCFSIQTNKILSFYKCTYRLLRNMFKVNKASILYVPLFPIIIISFFIFGLLPQTIILDNDQINVLQNYKSQMINEYNEKYNIILI